MVERLQSGWTNPQNLATKLYTCGHCGEQMGSHQGYPSTNAEAWCVRICTVCNRPTYFEQDKQFPGFHLVTRSRIFPVT